MVSMWICYESKLKCEIAAFKIISANLQAQWKYLPIMIEFLKQSSKVLYHDSWENISNTLEFCLMLLSKFYINGNLVFLKNKNTPSELGF